MANFGLARMNVVAPYAPMWREARSAIGAPEILLNAVESATIDEALRTATLVIGTGSLNYRRPEQEVVELPDLAPRVLRELEGGGRVAVVFGPEKHGLSRDDLSHCHCIAVIPTGDAQPSMNLGQAVAVCLYELAARTVSPASSPALPAPPAANEPLAPSGTPTTSGKLEILCSLIEQVMQAAGYSPHSMQQANRHDLRLLLRRLGLREEDTRRLLGLFRRILWRLEHKKSSS
jgi:tRNA/rRNA methyltransferase